mgnify:CR=1 FL=1
MTSKKHYGKQTGRRQDAPEIPTGEVGEGGEFVTGAQRLEGHGRAFGAPEAGGMGAARAGGVPLPPQGLCRRRRRLRRCCRP